MKNMFEIKILLSKFLGFGFDRDLYSYLRSYLVNGSQNLDYNGFKPSIFILVFSGVPQGSILGPNIHHLVDNMQ